MPTILILDRDGCRRERLVELGRRIDQTIHIEAFLEAAENITEIYRFEAFRANGAPRWKYLNGPKFQGHMVEKCRRVSEIPEKKRLDGIQVQYRYDPIKIPGDDPAA